MKLVKTKYKGKRRVYDIEVENVHNFYANGVNVHNCATDGGVSVITDSGVVWDITVGGSNIIANYVYFEIDNSIHYSIDASSRSRYHRVENTIPSADVEISTLSTLKGTSDRFYVNTGFGFTGADLRVLEGTATGTSTYIAAGALGTPGGLTQIDEDTTTPANGMVNYLTTTYQSGWMAGDIQRAYLANSKTLDRSVKSGTLVENGTVPSAAISTGSDVTIYGPFTAANNFTEASSSDWDTQGTGTLAGEVWFRSTGNSATEYLLSISNAGATVEFEIRINADGTLLGIDDGATAQVTLGTTNTYDDGELHKVEFIRKSSNERELWVDGVLQNSNTTDAGSITDTGNLPLGIGVKGDGSSLPATTTSILFAKLTATAKSLAQIEKAYSDEKPLFNTNAEFLLPSNTVQALAHNPDTNQLYVGTADGTAVYQGLVKTDYIDLVGTPTSDNIVAIASVRDSYTIGTAAETILYDAEKNLREDLLTSSEPESTTSETVTESIALNPSIVSKLDSTNAALTCPLGNGTYIGQIKTIVMIEASNSSTVSVTNHETSDPEVITFVTVDDTAVLLWIGTEWITLKLSGASV